MKKKDVKGKIDKKSKINEQNENKDDILLNYNEIEIDDFQVIYTKKSVSEINNKNNNEIKSLKIKTLDELQKSFNEQEVLEQKKEKYVLFDDLWDNIIKINNNNIIDLSLINEIQKILEDDDILIQRFSFLLFILLDNSIDNYTKNQNNFLILKNNIKFFMIILLNLKNNKKFNNFFTKEKIDYPLMNINKIQKIKNSKYKQILNNILFNIFSPEYNHLGSNLLSIINTDEKNLKGNNKIKQIKLLNEFYNSQKEFESNDKKNKINQKEKYEKIIDSLFNFESKNFLNFKKDKEIDYSLHFFHQIELVENIIFIVFSKEKYNFMKDNNAYYEYEFLDRLIKKNISETKEIHENKHRNLFRRDTISNDIIKYFFFIFGNSMIIKSIFKPLNTILKIVGLNNISENDELIGNKERNITKDEFKILFEKIMQKLNENIPTILKIFLKIIYDNIINFYPNLEKDDYTPISSLFFFSYISNPRIQKMFNIYPDKFLFIKSVYRLIYNASFNIKFKEDDNLYIFNDDIEIYYNIINEFYKNNIINIDMNSEENKKYLKNLFHEIGFIYPEFLFYLSCDNIHEDLIY